MSLLIVAIGLHDCAALSRAVWLVWAVQTNQIQDSRM